MGRNPLLDECGEKWVIEAVDAWSKHPGDWYWTRICAGQSEDERCIASRGEMCLSTAQANDLLTNPDSLVLETLQLEAITACKQIAVDKGAEMDTCATGLGEPFYVGRCKLSEELCFGDQTETSTDSGGTDSGGTSDTGGVSRSNAWRGDPRRHRRHRPQRRPTSGASLSSSWTRRWVSKMIER